MQAMQKFLQKLDKAIERVHKIEGTIERHKKQADKKLTELKKHNWSENPMDHSGDGDYEAYWLACEYQDKLSDMENSQKNLIKAQETAKNWKAKYNKQLELERHYQFEIPEVFKTLKDILVENWTKFDVEEQEHYYKKYKELGYKTFIQRYSRNRWDYLRSHNEQDFREENEKATNNGRYAGFGAADLVCIKQTESDSQRDLCISRPVPKLRAGDLAHARIRQ